ncbi:PepSY domain-containing protein [Ideonella sp. B508-1]|uniref:PepSY-associated TM helix domain-containing protein n=1 Tax=Ideonella sp. B508-1 TaxID=137716 RepID=UPI0003472195|nr:PepSY-associated TM helix domain-containing protein [Ideonella sp. B508-1]
MAAALQARERWRRWHARLCWPLGLLLALLGLSGSLLVYYPALDEQLNPALAWTPRDGAVTAWQPVWQALVAQAPERGTAWRIELPPSPGGMVTARLYRPAERAGAFFAPWLVTLHPRTLQPLARRFWGDTAMTWLYDLHYTLLAGATGRTVVGLLGLWGLAALLTGLVLWWPRSPAQWRTAWWAKAGAARPRRSWDQHRLTGLYGAGLLAVLMATGTALAWPDTVALLLRPWSHPAPAPAAAVPACDPLHGGAGLDVALAVARLRFPQGRPRWIDTPATGQDLIRVRLQQPGEPSARFPATYVWVDACSGALRGVQDPAQEGAGDALRRWLHPLHNGEAFGQAGRLLACLGGLLPAVLIWTGWRRRRDRQRGAAHRPGACRGS